MNKTIIGIVAILIVVGGVWFVSKKQSATTSDEPITIGFVGPLTGSGASWGEEQKAAVQIAVEEINKARGISGRKLDVIYEDGKCTGKDATTAAQKLISIDKVKIILTVCGSESLAIAPIAEKNHVLMMALWATHPNLTGAGQYIFRNSYSDDGTGKVMAETVQQKYKKVVMLTEVNDFSVGLRDAFKKYFSGAVIEENYSPETKDFKSYIVDLISKNPEAVILNPNDPSGGLVALKQLRQLGYVGQVYGNYFGGVNDVLKSSEAEGMIFFTDPDVGDNAVKNRLFSKFGSLSGHTPNFNFAVAVSYDSVYIIKQAIESAGSDTAQLKDYLHSLKDFNGVMGTYGFNDKGDAVGYAPSIKQIKGGQVRTYGE